MNGKIEGFTEDAEPEVFNVKRKKTNKKSGGFQSFGLCFPLLKAVQKRGYKIPTPIQRKSIPLILEGNDVVAMARTGSGKTACFLLPMFEKLNQKSVSTNNGPRALIMSPTRELALQTLRFVKELGKFMKMKAVAILGGDSMDQQFSAIHANPDIILATPGRFLHLCVEMDLKLNSIEYVVFDEADRLFEMGFGEQLKEIITRLPEMRQTLLFSATLPKLLVDFAKAGLNNPSLLRLDVESKLPDTLKLGFLPVRSENKPAALLCLLHKLKKKSQTLVFAATKHHVEYIHMLLDKGGISNTYLYSDLDPSARKINTAKFQNGNCSVLVVTDVAARGVDIPQLDFVINYHFPPKAKLFVHRVGRCARAGRQGAAYSLVSIEEAPFVLDLHLFLGKPINLIPLSSNDATSSKEDFAFGRIPENLIEAEEDEVLKWHERDIDLVAMTKVCSNGYKKYLKSRPGASVESVRRLKKLDLFKVGEHPLFSKESFTQPEAVDLIGRMKIFKPKGTIFELNTGHKNKSSIVMKTTKKAHEKMVQSFQKKKRLLEFQDSDNDDNVDDKEFETLETHESIENDSSGISEKRKIFTQAATNIKKRKFVDKEYYVPHFAPDRYTENGLSLNNFATEANKVGFDLTGDNEEGMQIQRQLRKWDKVRKKMVNVESHRVGKFKTESGNWISESYKTNRYAQWKEKSKVQDEDDDEQEGSAEENESQTHKFTKKDFPNTHWGRHNRKLAEKIKAKANLKRPEVILKERKEMQRKRDRSSGKFKRDKFKKPNAPRKGRR